MKYILLLSLILSAMFCRAQDISTQSIQWSSDKQIDVLSGKMIFKGHSIITYGNDSIVCKVKGESASTHLTIQSTSGAWTNLSVPGTIQFDVTTPDKKGTVTLRKTSSRTTIKIFLVGKDGPQTTEFFITESNIL